jgi:hypothetical protein
VASSCSSASGKPETSASMVARLNHKYNLTGGGKKKLSRTNIYRAVQQGKVGFTSPCKRGPPPRIPQTLLDVVATHSEVCQVGRCGELRGKDFKLLIGAAVLDTKYENEFKVESVWRKVLTEHPEKLQAAAIAVADDARLRWSTYTNLSKWFDDVKADLISSGLVTDRAVHDENGELVSEVDFGPPHRGGDDVKRRILNMDETHHDLSITSERGGPRSIMYHNAGLQRGFKPGTKAGRHVTGVYATSAAGEALPPMYIFDSSATTDKGYRVRVSWLDGLPSVEGRFGCPSRVESGSFFAVRSSGSMDDSLFNDYIERVVLPLFPNISETTKFDPITGKSYGKRVRTRSLTKMLLTITYNFAGKLLCGPVFLKVDSGPGRLVASPESITKRAEYFEMGLLLLMGLPNATAIQQEMDVLFQGFKAATYARGLTLLTKKLMLRGREFQLNRNAEGMVEEDETEQGEDRENDDDNDMLTRRRTLMTEERATTRSSVAKATASKALMIGFEELSIVVDGTEGDPLDMRPFRKFFTKERIVKTWEKVGFVPFTRKCLSHPKVRHELGQDNGARATDLECVQANYNDLVLLAEAEGLNAGVFDAEVPTAAPVQRVTDEDEQVKELVEKKGAFSASGLWNICVSRIGNSEVVIRAQQQQMQLQEQKNTLLSQQRADRRAKLMINAQAALQKHELSNGASLTDKDWGDVIRWVLPEAKVEAKMTDLRKKADIIAKLATLDRNWKTYIPPIAIV